VTEPGAATTALIHPADGSAHYTIELESVRIGNATFEHLSPIMIDSDASMSYLDKKLLDPIVEELSRRINLPKVPSPVKKLQLCYKVPGVAGKYWFHKNVPDMTLYLAVFGEAVTLKPENTFAELQTEIMCLAIAPVTDGNQQILGNIAQQNMHVGYDLDKGTVTFAPADCARSYKSPHVHG
jgi:hypothetical protein